MIFRVRTLTILAMAAVFAAGGVRAQQDCDASLRSPLGNAAGDARLVESLGRIKLGPFEVSNIPAGAIAVEGVQYVGSDIFFTFHLKIDAGNRAAKPSFRMAGPEIGGAMIQGTIRQLDVRGCLTIPGQTNMPRIEVPKKRFFAEILTPQASLPTTLAGTVSLRGHFVELRNRTDLLLSLAVQPSTGIFDLTASNATLDAVEIRGEGAQRSLLLKASFQLPGSSHWRFDLEDPKIRWESGRIRAAPVALKAETPYALSLPRLDLEFRELSVAEIELAKKDASSAVSINIKSLSLDAGNATVQGTPSFKGHFRSPFKTSGTLEATLSDESQLVVRDYKLADVALDLEVGEFADGGNVHFTSSTITLAAQRLTASEIDGTITVKGGSLAVNGEIAGNADIDSLTFRVSGQRDSLDGTGKIDIARLNVHGTVRTAPIDRCPGSNMDIDLKNVSASHVTGDIRLEKGKTVGSLDVSRFSATAGLSYYRCEWDQKVGHLGKVEMNGIPYPCPSWSNPFKLCQDHWVLWDGGDVFVHWVYKAEPTITDVGIEIADLNYDLEKARVCGGRIHGLSLGLYRVSLTPNLPGSGTVFDVFRDIIQALAESWQSVLVNTLGPILGDLKVVQLDCK